MPCFANGGMGRATLSIQIYSKTGINITIFYLYIALFKVKKSIIHRNQWLKLRDIIYQGKYGRSPTDVIKEIFAEVCKGSSKMASVAS